jgi:predicted O-methyltransferase YrrM
MSGLFKFFFKYSLTLLAVIRAYTLGIFVERYRFLIDLIADNTKVGGILASSVLEIKKTPAREVLSFIDGPLAFPIGDDGNITTKEVIIINHLVKTYCPARLFEIGTFDGRTTLNLALNSPPDAEVFTLDLPDDDGETPGVTITDAARKYKKQSKTGRLFLESEFPEAKKIKQLFGDSAVFDFSPYYGTVDFVFVDGSHEYDYVKNDTEIALRLLRGGKGIIVWHDYNYVFHGVVRVLNELHETEPFDEMVRVGLTSLVYVILG